MTSRASDRDIQDTKATLDRYLLPYEREQFLIELCGAPEFPESPSGVFLARMRTEARRQGNERMQSEYDASYEQRQRGAKPEEVGAELLGL